MTSPTIEEVLRQKRAELQILQKEVEALELTGRIMARAQATKADSKRANGKLSQPLMIKAVLLARRSEMHVKDISIDIKTQFGVNLPPKYLPAVIYRQVDKLFYKAKQPNTFGLMEWRQESVNAAGNSTGPH